MSRLHCFYTSDDLYRRKTSAGWRFFLRFKAILRLSFHWRQTDQKLLPSSLDSSWQSWHRCLIFLVFTKLKKRKNICFVKFGGGAIFMKFVKSIFFLFWRNWEKILFEGEATFFLKFVSHFFVVLTSRSSGSGLQVCGVEDIPLRRRRYIPIITITLHSVELMLSWVELNWDESWSIKSTAIWPQTCLQGINLKCWRCLINFLSIRLWQMKFAQTMNTMTTACLPEWWPTEELVTIAKLVKLTNWIVSTLGWKYTL